MAEIRINQLLR